MQTLMFGICQLSVLDKFVTTPERTQVWKELLPGHIESHIVSQVCQTAFE